MMRILIELTAGNVTNTRGGDSTVNKNARWVRKVARWLLALIRKVTESCSSAINRFNRKWFRTLSQPFSVETWSLLGIVVTRIPFNLPVRGLITQVTRK